MESRLSKIDKESSLHAASAFCTEFAALRMTSSTRPASDSIGTWLLATSTVVRAHLLGDEAFKVAMDGTMVALMHQPDRRMR